MIKTFKEIEIMQEGGKILSFILQKVALQVKPGITTNYLNDFAEKLIEEKKVIPSFKNYKGFPAALCTSLNEEIVHGLPSKRILKETDIISLDLGICFQGYHTDMAITLPVSNKVDPEALRLIRIVRKTLKLSLKKIYPGNHLHEIGKFIEKYISSQGFAVIKELCGHGIGKQVHEDPCVLNFKESSSIILKSGMVLCLEPMASLGRGEIRKSKYGYGFETIDNSLSAHFEATVLVTDKSCKVLTKLL
ncbi:MAG: type I methionyl aminopeptidase [Candidatus Pacebacteria bacterium]|nr:type I methionyl aminopeptidase [Candidatus Paceibacterota bacterium]